MARLTDQDVAGLIARLEGSKPDRTRPAPADSRLASATSADTIEAQLRLRELSSNGSLGPLITQRLATYLGRPVRCTSAETLTFSDDGPLYVAQTSGWRVWVRLQALLASAIADAMIGGDGEAPKVGYGSKVARVAAGAATEMMHVIVSALHIPEPVSAAAIDATREEAVTAAAGGTVSVATHEYGWQAGIELAQPSASATSAQVLPTTPPVSPSAYPRQPAAEPAGGLTAALERARRQLDEMLGETVTFETPETVMLTKPRIPEGWLRLSLGSRGGGAIVLAIDRQTTATLVNSALRTDVASTQGGGTLVEAGAEVIVRATLQAFATELSGTPEELHHTERLSHDAMLAELPHVSVEHRITCGSRVGTMRWLIPERILKARTSMAGGARGT
ncbi:MAG TPA: hypothetical protein VGQ96_03740 [Candidatus Eremiobacteraceae bacterium]|nr:hypothetical protein [Candidatus Eremiobacteraceae bacterium]